MPKYKVWYFKHEQAAPALLGDHKGFDPADLGKTHTFLRETDAENLEHLFRKMQAESWSPNGEARPLIEQKSLTHTSMSMGDIIVDPAGGVWVVAMFGFDKLGNRTEAQDFAEGTLCTRIGCYVLKRKNGTHRCGQCHEMI